MHVRRPSGSLTQHWHTLPSPLWGLPAASQRALATSSTIWLLSQGDVARQCDVHCISVCLQPRADSGNLEVVIWLRRLRAHHKSSVRTGRLRRLRQPLPSRTTSSSGRRISYPKGELVAPSFRSAARRLRPVQSLDFVRLLSRHAPGVCWRAFRPASVMTISA